MQMELLELSMWVVFNVLISSDSGEKMGMQ
jgi:hypothetical protein